MRLSQHNHGLWIVLYIVQLSTLRTVGGERSTPRRKDPPQKTIKKSVGSTLRLYPKLERHPGWLLYMSDILLLRPNNVRLPDGRFLAGVFVLDLVRFTSVFWIDT